MKNLDASQIEQFLAAGKEKTFENPDFMNNFNMLMPGGFFRSDRGFDEKIDQIMDKIDELLKTEFPQIDAMQIHQAGMDFINNRTPETTRKWKEAEGQMLLIYRRLIELGFDANDLRR